MPLTEIVIPTHSGVPEVSVYVYVVLDPLCTAIETCEVFKAVAGHMLFSGSSGILLNAPILAMPLLYKAQVDIAAAAEWLISLLRTREAKVEFKAAIWGLSVDNVVPLVDRR